MLLTSLAAVEGEFADRARPQGDAIVILGCFAVGASFFVARSTACIFACRGRRDGALEERDDIGMAVASRGIERRGFVLIEVKK